MYIICVTQAKRLTVLIVVTVAVIAAMDITVAIAVVTVAVIVATFVVITGWIVATVTVVNLATVATMSARYILAIFASCITFGMTVGTAVGFAVGFTGVRVTVGGRVTVRATFGATSILVIQGAMRSFFYLSSFLGRLRCIKGMVQDMGHKVIGKLLHVCVINYQTQPRYIT